MIAKGPSLSALVESSHYRALSDDALKDEDNAAWVMRLGDEERGAWVQRIHWIRLADRLAENQLCFQPGACRFAHLREGWARLRDAGTVDAADSHRDVLEEMRKAWFSTAAADDTTELCIGAWDAYLDALGAYHGPSIRIRTLAEHDEMVWRLSGRIFQLMPFLPRAQWDNAGQFGALDQFMNNLRDLDEDAKNGICYIPEEVLARFDLSTADILTGRCFTRPGFRPMMAFWIGEHLCELRRRAAGFLAAADLPPSLVVLRRECLRRYDRVERVLRACGYDFRLFPKIYWPEVRRDLEGRKLAA